jgi:hypothetical protein
MQGSLLGSSSNAYLLLAKPLYLVGVGILNSLAFIPTSIWVQIGCGASAVQANDAAHHKLFVHQKLL